MVLNNVTKFPKDQIETVGSKSEHRWCGVSKDRHTGVTLKP